MSKSWTIKTIKEGFEFFRNEHGRLPMALEIDRLNYLPSSRLIQKTFGGLEKLRTQLGYQDSHFGKGVFRSEIANRVNKRGRNVELALEQILQEKFGEVFVHTEKIFDISNNRKNRVDFYIYSPDGNFGVDVFYPETMESMQSNVNIKIGKYRDFSSQLFFVVANKNIRQADLDRYVNSKTRPLSGTTKIITLKTLLNFLESKRAYPNPLIQ